MRTVTFSEPDLQNLLNQNFVNTFSSTRGDPTAGQSIKHRPTDPAGQCIRGNGKQNVQMLFMTPAGEIFHVATGFLSADDLQKEARFSLKLFDQLQKNRDSDSRPLVAQLHRDRLREVGFDEAEINSQSEMARLMKMDDGFGAASSRRPNSRSQSQNSFPEGNVFQRFIEQQFLGDNQFSIKHPLISHKQLERDPTVLVGSGQSFFGSSSSGN
jgi:hypothetical protein